MRIDRVVTTKTDDDVVELDFLRESPGSPSLERVGTMLVRFFGMKEPHAGRVRSIEVSSEDGGLTGADLQRLGWSKWLQIADTTNRRNYLGLLPLSDPSVVSGDPEEDPEGWAPRTFPGEKDERYSGWFMTLGESFQRSPIAPKDGRPGRRGHPRQHYERVAVRYEALRAEGRKDPTARIAKESNVSRNTAAGWVRRARDLELLPPPRRGRAG